jgi:hypothetical protein
MPVGRDGVAGIAAAVSIVAAAAGAALIIGSRLAVEQWPNAAHLRGATALRLAAPSSTPASAAAAPTRLQKGRAPQVSQPTRLGNGLRAATTGTIDAIATGLTAAHVPQTRRRSSPPRQPAPAPAIGRLESLGEAGGALVTRDGAAAGNAVAHASPPLARTVAAVAADTGAAFTRGARAAAAIIRRLRERP